MEYINNIKSGFTVKIDEHGNFSGILRSGKYHNSEQVFSGNIHTMTYEAKLRMEAILESAFPEMRKKFVNAYETLLPGFDNGFIVLV